MSDSRDDLLERARDVLLRVGSLAEQIAQRLHQLLVDARPALLKFAEGLRLIEQSPPVPGYEAVLIDRGHHPLAARILAWNLLRLGNELLEEIRAERKLASAILRVVTAGDATPLVISRRARAITAALNDGMAMPALCAAWAKAGISSETAYSIGDLAERAMRHATPRPAGG
ncbi:hypothetical protein [Methylocystis rosea]|uniref:hypothetical protein n=1 Tax=Methylocystis rosea TaxID=173366 RepID=UPI0003635426|nr:hypothetical protein [Methylocystis rosea]